MNVARFLEYIRDYESPAVVQNLSGSPRFGHTRDFSTLFVPEESSDYIIGLGVAAGITAALLSVFMLLILILMCCGQKRVGFLSGRPFEVSYEKENPPEQAPVDDKNHFKKGSCCRIGHQSCVRAIFIVSGIMFILFAILMVTMGITNLQDTVNTVQQSSAHIRFITSEAKDIINVNLRDVRGIAFSIRTTLRTELARDNFCPGDPDLEGYDSAKEIRTNAEEALSWLDQMVSFDELDEIEGALSKAEEAAQYIQEDVADVDLTNWHVLIFLIPFTIVPCLLVAAAILAQFGVHFQCLVTVSSFFLIPLLVFMSIICVIGASTMTVFTSANTDFCLPQAYQTDVFDDGTPDTTVMRILEAQGFTAESNHVGKVAEYYIKQCQDVEDPYSFLFKWLPELRDGKAAFDEITHSVETDSSLAELSVYCNRDFDTLEMNIVEMGTILTLLVDSMTRTLDLLSCERIVPLYHLIVYDGACKYSVSALFWMFSCFLVMGGFSLVMLLLRSAYRPTHVIGTPPPASTVCRKANEEEQEPRAKDNSDSASLPEHEDSVRYVGNGVY